MHGRTINHICREMDIGKTAVRRWIKQYGAEADQPNIGDLARRIRHLESENRRLLELVDTEKAANASQEADIQKLRQMVDVIPKVLAVFVRELK